jgi:hypothetical protein
MGYGCAMQDSRPNRATEKRLPMMRLVGSILPAIILSLGFALSFSQVQASPICRQLERELAGLGRGSPAMARKYDHAIATQRRHLDRVRASARQAGCGGLVLFGRTSTDCRALNDTIRRMEANLAKLEQTRAGLGGRKDAASQARILAALEANGCRMPPDRTVRKLPDGGLFRQLNRVPLQQGEDDRRKTRRILDSGEAAVRHTPEGRYRSLCVRVCDGYYFPISFAASPELFARDENSCKARCPDTEVRLYTHRVPEEEPEDMVSLSGVPYAELPNAFIYRKPGFRPPAGCTCRSQRNFTVISEGTGRKDATVSVLPDERNGAIVQLGPSAASVSEKSAIGNPDQRVKAMMDAPPLAEILAPEERRVRVVGPVFLPDPEEAIDLQAPAPTDGR